MNNHTHLCDHDNCLISSLRGLRNGVYYGAKVRFVHSLVNSILFGKGSLKERAISILLLTWEYSRNLGLFVFIYKTTVCLLTNIFKSRTKMFNFLAGLVGSYFVWSEKTAVNTQIMLYLLSRNILAIAKIITTKYLPGINGFPISSILVWGVVMYLFEVAPSDLQPSLTSSMNFIYKESNHYKTWKDFIPFLIPDWIM
jgi:peroxisomal membrane protein 4